MNLPLSLRRWRRELSIFPSDIAASIGRFMPSLARLIGPNQHSDRGDGEPDGFDGVSRRGPYERLLPTEWGIKRVAPLEFMRRSAENEQSFFDLAFERPRPRRGTVVLFDSGPEQLGACRIVQLALLVLLHERAASQGASFGWQSLLGVGENLFSNFDEMAVKAFLQARSALSVSTQGVRSWEERFAGAELWLVGNARLIAGIAKSTFGISLSERATQGEPIVDVRLHNAGTRRIALEIPAPPIATRLLRNPFELPKSAVLPPTDESPDFAINAQGSRVFFRMPDGRLGSLPTQGSVRSPRFLLPTPQMTIVAAGTAHKRMNWLSVAAGVVAVQSSKPLIKGGPPVWVCPGPLLSAHSRLWPLELSQSPLSAVFVASDESLWRADFIQQKCEYLAAGVSALTSLGGGTIAATVAKGRQHEQCVMIVGSRAIHEIPFQRAPEVTQLRAVDGHTLVLGRPEGDIFHIARLSKGSAQQWTTQTLRPPPHTSVIGLDANSKLGEVGLFLLDDRRRTLSVAGRSYSRTLVTTTADISSAVVSSWHGRIAYAMRNGCIGFYGPGGNAEAPVEVAVEFR